MNSTRAGLRFLVVVLWVTAAITAIGAMLGAGLWPLAGLLARTHQLPIDLAMTGARTLGFYFLLWAPGTGIVIATIHAWRQHHRGGTPNGAR